MLASTMEGHALFLSLQMYGCRVVQKARHPSCFRVNVTNRISYWLGYRVHFT
jgi:hypothetical protein